MVESDLERTEREHAEARYVTEKRRLLDALGEDCPSHESPARLRRRLEWDREEERYAS